MTTATTDLPVFGDVTDEDEDTTPRTSFGLVARYQRGRKTTTRTHHLTAYARTDAGSLLVMLGGKEGDGARQFRGIAAFLLRTLVDDDGVPLLAEPRLVTDAQLELAAQAAAGEESPGAEVATTDGPVATDARWRLVYPDTGELADDDTFDDLDAAQRHAAAHPSSKRLFSEIVGDVDATVHIDALQGIVGHIAEKAAGRPTKPSKPSSGSRPRRKR